jgi:hypothetical protein
MREMSYPVATFAMASFAAIAIASYVMLARSR